MGNQNFILASKSPRRIALLKEQGYEFDIVEANVTENMPEFADPAIIVIENARLKAEAVAKLNPDKIVLAADTIVAINELILGKPQNDDDALKMLVALNHKKHKVLTGYSIVKFYENTIQTIDEGFVESIIEFANFSPETYKEYIATKEPADKAGAYAVQGLAARFIKSISGSYTNIVGLPVFEVMHGLKRAGINFRWPNIK
jgi:septum formation protein